MLGVFAHALSTLDALIRPEPWHVPHAGPPGPIPADHAMLRRADLAKAADGAVAALVALLKRPAVDTLNGPLRIVAVQARRPM